MKHKISVIRRRNRVRRGLRGHGNTRLRLSVHRSNKYIYAQVIDDSKGLTLVAASSMESDVREQAGATCNVAAAQAVGKAVAERAISAGVQSVVFDRGSFLYHGRVKSLADAAREAGLSF